MKIEASSAYLPQTDGQTEILNKKVEEFLHCFVVHHEGDWDIYLVAAEVAFNRSPNTVSAYSLFFLNNGFEPFTVPVVARGNSASYIPAASYCQTELQTAREPAVGATKSANSKRLEFANR